MESTAITDSCGNSRIINEATIIETGNCTVKIRNYTFSGKSHLTHQDEYLVPIYSKPLQHFNYTKNDEDNLDLRIQNLEELNEIQISTNHVQKRVTFGGLTLVTLTLVCFFFAFLYKKHRAKTAKKHEVKLPELVKAEQVKGTTTDENTLTEDPSRNKTQKHGTTPRFELLKNQTRTLDT